MWPPNFTDVYKRRVELLNSMRADPNVRHAIMLHYENNPVDFILDWATTYDPRKKGDIPKRMPFCLFPRQIELVWFLQDCIDEGESGFIVKAVAGDDKLSFSDRRVVPFDCMECLVGAIDEASQRMRDKMTPHV